MLSYCEVTETPFFYFYFTTGGRPIKLSSGSDDGSFVRVDLVLATLETKHRGTGTGSGAASRTQQQGSQAVEQQRHLPSSQNETDPSNGNHLVSTENKSGRKRNASQESRGEDGDEETVPLSYRDGFDGYYRDPSQQQQNQTALAGNDSDIHHNSDNVDRIRPGKNKRRLKRLNDSSSDEEAEGQG